MRNRLYQLGLNRARILDIHYPAHVTVAILVHKDYLEKAKALAVKRGIQIKGDFNPRHHSVVQNPDFKDKDDETRTVEAYRLNNQRTLRTIAYLRTPINKAVARDFYKRQWITQEQMNLILSDNRQVSSNTNMDVDLEQYILLKILNPSKFLTLSSYYLLSIEFIMNGDFLFCYIFSEHIG